MRTLYANGRIYSAAARQASALLVEDTTIAWIGRPDGLAQEAGVRIVDLAGAYVTPAFVDAHVHMTSTGLALTGLDLGGASSLAEVLDAVARAARGGRGRPILGSGWDESGWPEGRPPTNAELDRAAYGGSVYLARVDVHSAVASSVLMSAVHNLAALAGFQPDGWLRRDAHDAVRRAAYAGLSAGHIRDAQLAALRRAASLGIACVHEMAGPSVSSIEDLAALLELGREPGLPEVVGYWGELFGIDTARELGAVGAGGDLFCDGSLGSHTAALHAPYADRPESSGALRFDTADMAEHIVRCDRAGLQAGFHAIGDAAVDQVLDAFDLATARLTHGGPADRRRGGAGHRIEHAEMVTDVRRLAASGLTASVQPAFDATWGGAGGMYAERLGPERAQAMNRFAELAVAGVALTFGSDSPVTPLAPWAAVRAASEPSTPGPALSPAAAFTAHTRAGWCAAGRAGEGVLEPGAPATFAVWDADPAMVTTPDQRVPGGPGPRAGAPVPPGLPDLGATRELPACVRTVRRGVAIYCADGAEGR